jgi:poly(hydroxyalkanoate) depolymerase family esterase
MNAHCEENKCFVLYPEQPSSANTNKCWNWFETAHQARGAGEPALIVSMAQSLFAKYKIDEDRVFVAGLSAGAAMSAILGVTYPDVFHAVCVAAGLEYKAATSTISALTAMSSGGPAPATQGQLGYKAAQGHNRKIALFVTHGSSDSTVAPINGKQVVSQYATTFDLTLGNGATKGYITDTPTNTTTGQVAGGRSYTTSTYVDKLDGNTLIAFVVVNGMVHAWSGGSSSGTYTDPKGPDASALMIQYFYQFTNKSSTTSSSTGSTATSSSTTSQSTSTTSTSTSTTTTTGSTTGGGNTALFTSIASEDGFVGKLATDGYSNTVCKIGDNGMYNTDTYRTILSFDTSSLPSSVQITDAVLKITRISLTGSLKPLLIDIKSGTFGSSTTLAQNSYYATASATNIGSIAIPTADGSSSEFALPSSAYKYVFAGNNHRCQIMLRMDPTSIPEFAAHLLQITDGGATLTVTYKHQ